MTGTKIINYIEGSQEKGEDKWYRILQKVLIKSVITCKQKYSAGK